MPGLIWGKRSVILGHLPGSHIKDGFWNCLLYTSVSSANKCIQGVPGFSFIICNRADLIASAGKARSLSLDLYDQWKTMHVDGKWRFTSPTHVVLAFAQALRELKKEGGIDVYKRQV